MNPGKAGAEPAIDAHQELAPHSLAINAEAVGATDLDAFLGDHALDPHLKHQLEQLDNLELDHIGEEPVREVSPVTPSSQSGTARNPLASHPEHSDSNSGSTTPRMSSVLPMASPSIHSPSSMSSQPARPSTTEVSPAHNSRQGSLAPTEDDAPRRISSIDSGPESSSLEVSSKPGENTQNGDAATNLVNISPDNAENSNQDTLPPASAMDNDSANRVSAYARLDFDSFTFYVQTLQVVLGRRSENGGPSADVDVHLGAAKAISRRHAKIFYNFATQRFELTVIGRNGAFVGDIFVETGSTVPLRDSTKVQIGQIAFKFVLPMHGQDGVRDDSDAPDGLDEELEVEDTGVEEPQSNTIRSKGTSERPIALGSESGRGGKLKQRSQSAKSATESHKQPPIRKDASESMPREQLEGTPASENSHMASMTSGAGKLHTLESLNSNSSSVAANMGAAASENSSGHSQQARAKPRQSSFLRRADENNLFAHVPPDQLAAVNAQVDAAIAGLPDIPGFDTPATGLGGSTIGPTNSTSAAGSTNQDINSRDAINWRQLLELQTSTGLQQNNLSNLGVLMGLGGNSGSLNGTLQETGGHGVNNNLQQLQSLQGLQNLQGIAGIPGFPGLQPAAGAGIWKQLQDFQKAAANGGQQVQTRQKRKPKREYRPEEIPEQYRTKPAHSYSHLITAALRDRLSNMPEGTQGGLSLGDIYDAIMDLFPYYKYCPPGWQNSVRHNLSSSKSFRKVSKEGKGWLWGLDEDYLAEKEKQRQRALQRQQQQALAQQQAMAEQHAREQAREQARQLQLQKDRDRELEQRRFLAERAARAAQAGVPLHQLSENLGNPNFNSLRSEHISGTLGSSFGESRAANMSSVKSGQSKPAVLPAETVKLLAGLQQHVQQELAKEGQPPLNPQLLSNALAVVIAQTAKQAGGLHSLNSVLQQPGAVQKLLNQAMQLLRSTQRVPAPTTKPSSPLMSATDSDTGSSTSTNVAAPSSAQIQAQPRVQSSASIESHSSAIVGAQKAQPQVLQPVKESAPQLETPKDRPMPTEVSKEASKDASETKEADESSSEAKSAASSDPPPPSIEATPSTSVPPKSSGKGGNKKQQPSLEKISEILAKAEAIPNPTAEVKGMIEKLKAHKRQLELKRGAEVSSAEQPAPKRAAVG